MKIKQVIWRDSRMYIEQCAKQSDFEVCEMRSVGFVIEDTDDHIVISGDLVDYDNSMMYPPENYDLRRVIVIPKENIISCRGLSKKVN